MKFTMQVWYTLNQPMSDVSPFCTHELPVLWQCWPTIYYDDFCPSASCHTSGFTHNSLMFNSLWPCDAIWWHGSGPRLWTHNKYSTLCLNWQSMECFLRVYWQKSLFFLLKMFDFTCISSYKTCVTYYRIAVLNTVSKWHPKSTVLL